MLRDLLILYTLFFRMGARDLRRPVTPCCPILRREIIQNHQWMDEETIMDYYALSQGSRHHCHQRLCVHRLPPPRNSRRCGRCFGHGLPLHHHHFHHCILPLQLPGQSLCPARPGRYLRMRGSPDSGRGHQHVEKGVKDAFGIVVCLVMLCLSVFTDLSPILLVIACALLGIGAKKITGSVRKEGEGK